MYRFFLAFAFIPSILLSSATVTNTNDSGAGSLRQAVSDGGDITIETSGTLNLQSTLNIQESISITGTGQDFQITSSDSHAIQLSGSVEFVNQASNVDVLSSSGLTINMTEDNTWPGNIFGQGPLTKEGKGTLVLSGQNSYIGGTLLDNGTVTLSSEYNLGANELTLSGGTLNISEGFATNREIVLAKGTRNGDENYSGGSIDVDGGKTLTTTGTISGSGALTKSGEGNLVLSGTNSYDGGTTFQSGVVRVSADSNLGSGNLTFSGGTLNISEGFATNKEIVLAKGTRNGDENYSGGSIDIDKDKTLTTTGTISGSGALTKSGEGKLVLSGTNSYDGGTTFQSGVVSVSADANLGSGNLTFNGGTLNISESFATNRFMVLPSPGSIDVNTGKTLTTKATISGLESLIKSGEGRLVLTGMNTYVRGTVLQAGVVSVSAERNLGTRYSYLTFAGGTLNISEGFATNKEIVLAKGTRNGDENYSGGSIDVDGGKTLTAEGVISGSGALTKSGDGYLALNGNNTFSGGLTVDDGVVYLGTSSSAGTGKTTVNGSGKVISSSDAMVSCLAGDGEVSIPTGHTLTVNNTEPTRSQVSVLGEGDLMLTGGHEWKYEGEWQHTGDLIIDGKGTSFRSNNTLTSNTMHVRNGGAIRGNQLITHLHLESQSTLSPGNSVGTTTITGDAKFYNGSFLEIEFDGFGHHDLVTANGSITVDPGANIVFVPIGLEPIKRGDQYTFLTSDTGINGQFDNVYASWHGDPDRHAYFVSYTPGAVHMTVGPRQAKQSDGAVIYMTSDLAKQLNDYQMDNIEDWLTTNWRSTCSSNKSAVEVGGWRPFAMYAHRGGGYSKRTDNIGNHFDIDGLAAGIEYSPLKDLQVALGYGYSYARMDGDGNTGQLSSNNNSVIAYVNYDVCDQWHWNLQMIQTFSGYDSSRTNRLGSQSTASYSGYETGVQSRLGYSIPYKEVQFLPMCKVRYDYTYINGYNETGPLDEALSTKGYHVSQLYGELGLDVSLPKEVGGWTLSPHAGVFYLLQLLHDSQPVNAAFNPEFINPKNIQTSKTGRNFGRATLGLDASWTEKSSLFVDVDTIFGEHLNFTWDARAGVAINF